MSDLHEMLAGTDLKDPGSRLDFRLVKRDETAGGTEGLRPVRVTWQSVPGKTYQLEYVLQLGLDPVTGAAHEIIPVGNEVTAAEGDYEIEMVVDVPTDALTGMFRVRLVPE